MGVVLALVIGLMVGSFLNVCILRFPRNESIVRPASHCPHCKAPVRWYDNVPVLSWIALRGRCRACGEPISLLYPSVEAATGVIWGWSAFYYGVGLEALEASVFLTILLGIAVTDAREYVIPDEFSLGGLVMGLVFAAVSEWPRGIIEAAVGAAVGFGLLYVVAWAGAKAFGKEAMGGGDIKMMAMVGSFVGWFGVLLTVFGGALVGSVVFGPIAIKRKLLVPFGIFLAIAAAVVYVYGDAIAGWYFAYLRGT